MAITRTKTMLKDLTPLVERILTEKVKSRDDDHLLYCYFLNTQGISKNISFWTLCSKIKNKELPSLESIGRIRRKVQELNPALAPSKSVKESKTAQEQEYREYARDLTNGYGGFND